MRSESDVISMLYVSYVAVVAILNVGMGFMLAMVVTSARSKVAFPPQGQVDDNGEYDLSSQKPRDAQPIIDPPSVVNELETPGGETSAEPLEHDSAKSGRTREDESDGSWAGIATVALDHSKTFQIKLQSILQRVETASHANQTEELGQLMQLTLGAASDWLVDAERVSGRLLGSLGSTPDGKAVADRCERIINDQLAQTETSTSNISMIDWQVDVHAGATRLSQELMRLIESSTELQTKVQQLVDFVYQQVR